METSFPGHITTVDQEEPPRQMGRGEDREPSRTISAGFPSRSGFVQRIRLDRASEAQPRSEPFVGRARSLRLGQPTENIYSGKYRMQLLAGKTVLRQGVGRNRCGSRRPPLALAHRLCPDSRQTAMSIWSPRSPVTSQRLIKKIPLAKWGEVKIVNPVARFPPHFLRVAASSNTEMSSDAAAAKVVAGSSAP